MPGLDVARSMADVFVEPDGITRGSHVPFDPPGAQGPLAPGIFAFSGRF